MVTLDSIKIDNQYLRSLLEEMIKIDSRLGQESNLAQFLGVEAEKLGLEICFDEVAPNRENLYAKYSFSDTGETITFNGHSDTVDVCEGWTFDPFSPSEEDGKLFGLGSVDQKAGLACQLTAIKSLIESDEKLNGTIHFTAVVDEEGYGSGAAKMLRNEYFGKGNTSAVIISEPCYGDSQKNALPLGMTGKVLYKITVKGQSAHAFRPELGINAISDASKIVNAIENIMNDSDKSFFGFKLPYDDDFGYGSFCILKIEGGYKIYSVVVPEHCEIILNRLTTPKENRNTVEKDMLELIANLRLKSNVRLEIVPPFYYSYKLSKDTKLFRIVDKTYQDIFNIHPYTTYLNMITDANAFMGEGGIPTINFGPKGDNLHAPDEYVEISTLEPTAQFYSEFYYNYQKEKE
ncbi:MAG: M20 family metallopeptidase [Candidatus Thorarchaeota archaeon]